MTLECLGDFLPRPSRPAQNAPGRVTVGARDIAEHLIVGAVFADDEKAVLEMRQRRVAGDGRGVRVDHGLGQDVRRGRTPIRIALRLPSSSEPM